MRYFQRMFEQRCLATGASTHLSFFTATFSILFMISNIPGNLLVILAVAIDPHKNLRSPFDYLMANLAVADLVVGTVIEPISVIFHIKEGLRETLSLPAVIRTLHMSYFISSTASVLGIATLAVERYLATCNPHTYRNKLTGRRILLTIAGIWFISLTLPFVYFEVGFITYAFIFANTSVVVAVGITCFTYAMMLYKYKRRVMVVEGALPTTVANGLLSKATSTPTTSALHDNATQWEQKITKMFLVVMIALLCCYGPSTIFIYTMSFCESCSCDAVHWFRDLQFLFVIMNSNVNFYCYALRSTRFRKAIAHILRIKRAGVGEPASNSGTRTTGLLKLRELQDKADGSRIPAVAKKPAQVLSRQCERQKQDGAKRK